MNRAWRSRAIQKIGFFAILAVLGLMVVRWCFFMRAQAMPTTLDMTYSNQQNNRRAGLTFTIGDAVYYPSRNGMGYMVQGREGKVSFSQRLAQESEAYVVYTKGEDDTYRVYVYSKAEEAVVLKIKDVVRWRLVGNTLFYAKARIEYTISEYYPEDVYAVSLDTRQEKLLAENVMNYLVLREDKLIYALYRDVEYEKAKEKLIEHNLRLVAHIVKKYNSPDRDLDDLISIGTIGLIKAVNTFDLDKGGRLVTYAARCIENELLMMLRQEKKILREVSLYEPIGTDQEGNHISLLDIISTDEAALVDQYLHKYYLSHLEQEVFLLEDSRERTIILKRYGLCGNKPHTQKEVAAMMGISRSYVSRIEKKALEKLRNSYEEYM